MKKEDIKKNVRENYARIAVESGSCCSPNASCCGDTGTNSAVKISTSIGYSDVEQRSVPNAANLGLGCGNPTALASLKTGETVLDLGAGAGFDCFLSANKVGKTGRVIGIDMTPEMLDRARENAVKGGYENVEFRLGEIENMPVADNSVDAIISNCVINLSTDKPRVFSEAYRVLKPGGRFMISDMVLVKDIPPALKNSVAAYVGCISGAMKKDEYLGVIRSAGFKDVGVMKEAIYPIDDMVNTTEGQKTINELKLTQDDVKGFTSSILSITVQGFK